LSNTIATEILDRINTEEWIREVGEEEVMKSLKQVVEMQEEIISNLQKQLIILEETKKMKRKEQEKEWTRREYKKR